MKPCFGKRKLLAWLALGELDESRARNLQSHVQTCAGCRRYLEDLSCLRQELAAAEATPAHDPSASFHRKWVSRLKEEHRRSRWQMLTERPAWRVALPTLGGAAILVMVALAFLSRQPRIPAPVVVRQAQATQTAQGRDLSPSVANYRRAVNRSLDEFDDLLTAQAQRRSSPAPAYIASIFAAAISPN
jgi:hypothetical protein